MALIENRKGFTLIEVIIVMAIFSILMIGITAMLKPITNLADISTDYDTQRTVANEINTYVQQNLRYATYAQVYSDCNKLPSVAIGDFKTFSGLTDSNDIHVMAIINNFSGANINTISADYAPNRYNGVATEDDYGRVFMSSSITEPSTVTYYTAMGKWYYGNNKYQFDFSCDEDATTHNWEGVTTMITTTYEKGNAALKATNSARFLNYTSVTMSTITVGTGVNTYIVYTMS